MPKSTNKVNPLSWNVPIVTSDGTPTNEFQRKWLQQAKTNTDIIPLNTPEEVSAVLDVIEDTPTSILVRGTTLWEGWTPTASSIIVTNASGVLSATVMPGDATKFLNGAVPSAFAQVKDSDLLLSDITTNNVSITKHGFAPKAPNDATKYLDGTGSYSTPSGGTGFLPLTGGALAGPGNLTMAGYLGVGSASAPTNTTAGDITGTRMFLGPDLFSIGSVARYGYQPTAFKSGQDWQFVVGASASANAAANNDVRLMFFRVTMAGAANATNLNGLQGDAIYNGTGTLGSAVGATASVRSTAAGTVSDARALSGQVFNSGSTITAGYTLRAEAPSMSGGGTIGALSGLYIGAQKGTGVTKGYGINAVGTNDLNVLAGFTSVGTTSDPGTSCALDVVSTTGAVRFPSMTTTQRLALTASNGMIVYDSTQSVFQAYGNGVWAPMIGGGGSGGGNTWAVPGVLTYTPDTGAFATLTNAFVPAVPFTVDRIIAAVNNATIGNIYSAFIATINVSTGAITGTVATASARITTTAAGQQTLVFTIPVTPLTAGTAYIFAVVITSGTGTTACAALLGSSSGYSGLPVDAAKMQTLGAQTKRFWYAQNSDAPTSGAPISNSNVSNYFVGVRAQL